VFVPTPINFWYRDCCLLCVNNKSIAIASNIRSNALYRSLSAEFCWDVTTKVSNPVVPSLILELRPAQSLANFAQDGIHRLRNSLFLPTSTIHIVQHVFIPSVTIAKRRIPKEASSVVDWKSSSANPKKCHGFIYKRIRIL
jgi:hypothetical protein